jgi:hypothetical protein
LAAHPGGLLGVGFDRLDLSLSTAVLRMQIFHPTGDAGELFFGLTQLLEGLL